MWIVLSTYLLSTANDSGETSGPRTERLGKQMFRTLPSSQFELVNGSHFHWVFIEALPQILYDQLGRN